MRTAIWTGAIVAGGWSATMVGYYLSFAAVLAARPADVTPDATTDTAGVPMAAMVFLLQAGVVAAVVGLGGVLAVRRAGLGRPAAGVVAAIGPVGLVTMALLLLSSNGGTVAAMVWGVAAAVAGTVLGTCLGAGRRTP